MRVTGREKFVKYKPLIQVFVKAFGVFGKKANYRFLKFFRNTDGVIGLVLRYVFLKNCCKKIGDNVSVHAGVYLLNIRTLVIGDNVSIHPMCYVDASGGMVIGDNVSIAHSCSILTTNHQWGDLNIPIKYNEEASKPVMINDDVWIGCGVRILAGVAIAGRSIVAAGAVVNTNIESNTIYGGIPAKKIKNI